MKLNHWILFVCLPLTALAQQPQNAIRRAQLRTFTVQTIPQPGELLTLSQAIAQAIEQNYQVRINRSQEDITRNNFTKGNAGYLPVLTGNANSNGGLQNINQTFLDGLRPRQVIRGIFNRTTNVGVNFNYTVFNGYARLIAFTQALDISRERRELARANYEVGVRSRVDYLSAQVDYNTDSAALLSQAQALRNAKTLLNSLLVRDPLTEFALRDTIVARTDLQLPALQESLTTNNPQLVAAVLNQTLADVNIRLANAAQLPLVTAQAGYNYQFIDNQGGFGVRTGRNNGMTYSLQANIPLFNGYNLKRQIQNARINSIIAQNQVADQRLQLQLALTQTYQVYQNSLSLLNLEVQNNRLANENVDIAYDRYRIGNSTFVEFRDVQRNAIDAQTRLIEAEFNAKAAEIELLRLSSTISQELVQ